MCHNSPRAFCFSTCNYNAWRLQIITYVQMDLNSRLQIQMINIIKSELSRERHRKSLIKKSPFTPQHQLHRIVQTKRGSPSAGTLVFENSALVLNGNSQPGLVPLPWREHPCFWPFGRHWDYHTQWEHLNLSFSKFRATGAHRRTGGSLRSVKVIPPERHSYLLDKVRFNLQNPKPVSVVPISHPGQFFRVVLTGDHGRHFQPQNLGCRQHGL